MGAIPSFLPFYGKANREAGPKKNSQKKQRMQMTIARILRGGFFKFLFIYLSLATPGLCCCAWAFSSCGGQGLLSSCGTRASHCGGFSCCRAQAQGHRLQPWRTCFIAPWQKESSQTRDQTCVPHIDKRILIHWTIREVPTLCILHYTLDKNFCQCLLSSHIGI